MNPYRSAPKEELPKSKWYSKILCYFNRHQWIVIDPPTKCATNSILNPKRPYKVEARWEDILVGVCSACKKGKYKENDILIRGMQ